MIKRFTIFTFVALFFTGNLLADDLVNAKKFADKVASSALSIAADKNKSLDKKKNELVDIVLKNVDTEWSAKFVLGKYWRQLTEEQKNKFVNLYKDYLVFSYAPKFTGYNGETYKILDVRKQSGEENEFLVIAEILVPNKPSIAVDFLIKKNSKNQFKIIDLVAEGVSFAQTQRDEFTGFVDNSSMENLLTVLEGKVNQMKTEFSNIKS